MDKDRFNTLLADMDKITDQDIKSLNQLRKQYPYFQNQYVMIAKALKKRNHPKTDAFIKKAAIYSADRALLKAIIMDEHDFAPIVIEESVVRPKLTETPAPVAKKAVPQTTSKAVEKDKPEIIGAPQEAAASKPVAEIQDKKPVTPEAKPDTLKEPVPKAEKPISKPAPEKPVAQNTPEQKVKETPAPLPEPKKAVAEQAQEKVKEVTPIPEAPQPVAAKPEDNQELIDELERDLKEIRKKKQLIAKMLEQQEAKQSPKKTAPPKKKTTAPRKSQSELIEKFIRNEPQMGKQKLVHDESELQHKDLAARFTSEQEDFYTETMAKLMVTQKKYRKAIKVYEKLGLKFPEKRAYFASQIEQVKSRSNV